MVSLPQHHPHAEHSDSYAAIPLGVVATSTSRTPRHHGAVNVRAHVMPLGTDDSDLGPQVSPQRFSPTDPFALDFGAGSIPERESKLVRTIPVAVSCLLCHLISIGLRGSACTCRGHLPWLAIGPRDKRFAWICLFPQDDSRGSRSRKSLVKNEALGGVLDADDSMGAGSIADSGLLYGSFPEGGGFGGSAEIFGLVDSVGALQRLFVRSLSTLRMWMLRGVFPRFFCSEC